MLKKQVRQYNIVIICSFFMVFNPNLICLTFELSKWSVFFLQTRLEVGILFKLSEAIISVDVSCAARSSSESSKEVKSDALRALAICFRCLFFLVLWTRVFIRAGYLSRKYKDVGYL